MTPDPAAEEHAWEHGWQGHERAQRERLARLTLEQKLDWLEEAHRFVLRMQAAGRPAPARGRHEPD